MLSRKWSVLWVALLAAGCGGGADDADGSPQTVWTPNTEPVHVVHVYANAGVKNRPPPNVIGGPAEPRQWPVAISEEPTLTVEDPYGRKVGAFNLRPVLGRGYAELRVTLTARRVGEALPPEPVRPKCESDARCVFGLSKPYILSLADDSELKLVPRGESVVIVARSLKLSNPHATEVVFAREDEEISRKKISLLTDYWTGAAKPL
jgi:hypothetical protein